MITHEDLVRIKQDDMIRALQHGEANPEMEHRNPMTGILRSAGRWLLDNVFKLPVAELLILRMQTTQVLGKMLYVPIGFVKNRDRKIVAIYVHLPRSRLATCDSVKAITVAGWAQAKDLRMLLVPGTDIICTKNDNVLSPMRELQGEQKQ